MLTLGLRVALARNLELGALARLEQRHQHGLALRVSFLSWAGMTSMDRHFVCVFAFGLPPLGCRPRGFDDVDYWTEQRLRWSVCFLYFGIFVHSHVVQS